MMEGKIGPEFLMIFSCNTSPGLLTSRIFYVRKINFTQATVLFSSMHTEPNTISRQRVKLQNICLKWKLSLWISS